MRLFFLTWRCLFTETLNNNEQQRDKERDREKDRSDREKEKSTREIRDKDKERDSDKCERDRPASADRRSKDSSPIRSRPTSREVPSSQPQISEGKSWSYPGLDIMATGAFWQNYSGLCAWFKFFCITSDAQNGVLW